MGDVPKDSTAQRLLAHGRRHLISGFLLLVPMVVTYMVLRFIFDAIDGLLQPVLGAVVGGRIPGLGLLVLIILVYLAGLLSSNVVGIRLADIAQRIFLRTPFIATVYSSTKQLLESFSGNSATGFKRVVIIEYPRFGAWAIGFLTAITKDENERDMAFVYIPTAPAPNSGWVAFVPLSDVYDTELSVPQAIRLVLSGGIMAPPELRKSKNS